MNNYYSKYMALFLKQKWRDLDRKGYEMSYGKRGKVNENYRAQRINISTACSQTNTKGTMWSECRVNRHSV